MTVWKQTREGSLMYVESDLPYKETNVNSPSSSEYPRIQCSIRISGVPDQSVLTVYNKVVRSQDLYDWVRSYLFYDGHLQTWLPSEPTSGHP